MADKSILVSLFVVVTITTILVVSDVSASSCPEHVVKIRNSYTAVHNNICYLFVNYELYFSEAREKCLVLGGEMLYIDNAETMDFMRKILDSRELSWNRQGVWLGASKSYGRWKWTNGRVMNYTNWAPGQPSKFLGLLSVEDCSQMRQDDDWKWHDIPCGSLSFHYNYICQFPLNKPGDVTGRVSSSAANQTHDNGYSTILAIIIGVSTTLLLIMGIIFLVLYWHDRKRKLKSNGALVHFSNNTYNGPLNGSTHPASHVPPIPTSPVPYSSDERLYLDPQENEDSKNNFQNISFSAKGRNCYQQRTRPSQPICSPPGTNLELGACGGSDAEKELQVPLMATAQKTNCELVETNCASSESLECCSLNHGEYIDMKSLAQKKDKSIKIDDGKHTYSNVDHRDSGIENLYEVLH